MSTPVDQHKFDETFPSSLDCYHDFVQAILDQLAAMGWRQGDLFAVHMALEESISNAIRHGNKHDPDKQVDVTCEISRNRFWARICDQGAGFQPQKVPDCCSPECLELPGGRGLALMNAFMTRVEYNDRGNCVTLEKRVGDAADQSTPRNN
jgi:serine/threonine-protein kinase RsbW